MLSDKCKRKAFFAQLATPLPPTVSLKVKNSQARTLYVGYCGYHLQICSVSQHALRSQCHMLFESQVLCFSAVFGPLEIRNSKRARKSPTGDVCTNSGPWGTLIPSRYKTHLCVSTTYKADNTYTARVIQVCRKHTQWKQPHLPVRQSCDTYRHYILDCVWHHFDYNSRIIVNNDVKATSRLNKTKSRNDQHSHILLSIQFSINNSRECICFPLFVWVRTPWCLSLMAPRLARSTKEGDGGKWSYPVW